MRRYFTPRCLGMHATILVLLPTFALLTRWQLDRALGGNTLSWAYTFEWPLFAGYAAYVWWQLIHDHTAAVPGRSLPQAVAGQPKPQERDLPGWALSGGYRKNRAIAERSAVDPTDRLHGERFAEQTAEEASQLEEYNRYLAELAAADEVRSGTRNR